jgi:hypothetical protein
MGQRRSRKRRITKKRYKKRSFGTEVKKDKLFDFLSVFIKPSQLINLTSLASKVSDKTLENITPSENVDLTYKEKIQRFFINHWKTYITNLINNLTPGQIMLLIKGKFNDEITNNLMAIKGAPLPEADESKLTKFSDKTELFILKSVIGKFFIKKIKAFIRNLTPTQLVLLMHGKYDLNNALLNASLSVFLTSKYSTVSKEERKKIQNEIIEAEKEN